MPRALLRDELRRGPPGDPQVTADQRVSPCRVLIRAAVLATVASCGGEGATPPSPPVEPESPRPTTIVIDPEEIVLAAGDTVRLTARVLDQRARTISNAPFTLESSDPSILAVADDRGLVRGLREGRAAVTARSGQATGTAPATVWSADRRPLLSLFESARGEEWTRRDGWWSEAPVGDWYGVSADGDGRVTALRLSSNGLRGTLPPGLGRMTRLVELHLDGNALVGPLPLSLLQLRLQTFRYGGTSVCVPLDSAFRDWLLAVPTREGPEELCVDERAVLEAVYRALNGPFWIRSGGWLSELPLGEWHGVETSEAGEVIAIELPENGLEGEIPVELTELARLEFLRFDNNRLRGSMPAQLGDIATLRGLYLRDNEVSGTIPSALGRLTELYDLELQGNELTGDIPPELGSLAGLTHLDLADNRLEGPIPPELGRLRRLDHLSLAWNGLSGPVPAELGGIEELRTLQLQDNPGLEGPLPESLTTLPKLEELSTAGTGLCAPRRPPFLAWLQEMRRPYVALCRDGPVTAYLTQAVQSLDFPVPLVAEKPALLRVFVASANAGGASMPDVRATFFLDDAPVHEANVPAGGAPIPAEPGEGNLALSANAVIPSGIVQPGLEVVLEVDREGALDPGLGVSGRVPTTGRQAIEVRRVPGLVITAIPIVRSGSGDDIIELVQSLNPDHELFWHTRALLPVGGFGVRAHASVTTTSSDTCELLREVEMIRVAEGGANHYLGIGETGGGCAYLSERAAYAAPDALVIAHELGHNMSLRHAPCGNAPNADERYPWREAATGAWGYDERDSSLVPPTYRDLMSYCDPSWVSSYHFTNAFSFRRAGDADAHRTPVQAGRQLLVSGRLDERGAPTLDPAFVIEARPALPREGGPWRLTGRSADGRTLFQTPFEMPGVEDHGQPGFVFAIPADPTWARELAVISLAGPSGTAEMRARSEPPMTIVRDPATGEVRAILRDAPAAALAREAAGGGPYAGLDVLVSRGLPDPSVWRR